MLRPNYKFLKFVNRMRAPGSVIPSIFSRVAPPSISGVAYLGQTLTVTPGTWPGSPVLTYQWYSDGSPISGETGLTYNVTVDVEGTEIKCVETANGTTDVDSNTIHLFVPQDIANYAYFDAADTSPSNIVQSGGDVSQLTDKSGNSRHANQPVAGNQPETNSRTLGGLNALDYDDTEWLQLANGYDLRTGDFSIMWIAERDTESNTDSVVGQWTSEGERHFITGGNGNDNPLGQAYGGGQVSDASRLMIGNVIIMTATFENLNATSTRTRVYVNSEFISTADATSLEDSPPTTIGGRMAAAGFGTWDGAIGEVVLRDTISTEDERQKLEAWVAWRRGQQALLDSSNPYKTSPPEA